MTHLRSSLCVPYMHPMCTFKCDLVYTLHIYAPSMHLLNTLGEFWLPNDTPYMHPMWMLHVPYFQSMFILHASSMHSTCTLNTSTCTLHAPYAHHTCTQCACNLHAPLENSDWPMVPTTAIYYERGDLTNGMKESGKLDCTHHCFTPELIWPELVLLTQLIHWIKLNGQMACICVC